MSPSEIDAALRELAIHALAEGFAPEDRALEALAKVLRLEPPPPALAAELERRRPTLLAAMEYCRREAAVEADRRLARACRPAPELRDALRERLAGNFRFWADPGPPPQA